MQLKNQKALFLYVTFMLLAGGLFAQTTYNSESELKEAASQFFEDQDFEKSMPLYSQLLSLYPKDPDYNYKYGASLLMVSSEREKALQYLKFAISKVDVDPEAYYYLGKAYHLNYDFSNAEKFYKRFKDKANSSLQKEYEVDRQLEMCENGRNLLRKINGTQVLNKQEISVEDFYRIYNLEGVEGKIIAKPEAFMSKYDKKINEKSIIYFPDNSKEVYFSSFGKDGKMGRDIYKVIKISDGSWSEPINIDELNTPYDENYVFAHPDGKTLFFSSKGHNSMGGYDLFKSTYDPSIATWGKPENMDFAFSTVDNDILFITDEEQKIAYFASDRNNSSGRITVYKVGTSKVPANLSLVKGKLITDSGTSQKAKITVVDFNNQTVGVFESDESGNYEIAINENGGTYSFNVETSDNDAPIHSGKVTIPSTEELKIFRQELQVKGSGDDQQLVIRNLFDEPLDVSEGKPHLSPEILMMQANLDVNSSSEQLVLDETKTNDLTVDEVSSQNQETASQKNTISNKDAASDPITAIEGQSDNKTSTINNNNVEAKGEERASQTSTSGYSSSSELVEEVNNVKADAQKEYESAQSEVNFAYYLAKVKSYQAQTALQEARQAKIAAELLPEAQQESSNEKVDQLRQKAGALAAQASFSMQLARILESETSEKKDILDEVNAINEKVKDEKNNVDETGEQLDNLKTTIAVRKEEKQSIEIQKEILQEKIEQSNMQLTQLRARKAKLEKEKREVENEVNGLQSSKNSASKKRLEEINEQLANLKLDAEDVGFQLNQANTELNDLQNKHNELTAELAFLNEFEASKNNIDNTISETTNKEKKQLIDQIKKYRQDQLFVFSNEVEVPLMANLPTEEELEVMERTVHANEVTENLNYTQPTSEVIQNSTTSNSNTITTAGNNTSSISAEETIDDFSNLKYDNSFTYSLPLAQKNREEAERLKKQARDFDQEYQQALDNVQNLTSFEARTTAFEKANQLQENSRAAQVAAAKAYAKANEMEYLQNRARLNSIDINDQYASSNEQIALLLTDEADLYYSYAEKIRDKILENDRFSKKETDLQKAYGYEMMALRKQEEAIEILGNRVETSQQASTQKQSFIQEDKKTKVLAPEINSLTAEEVENIEIDESERNQITASEDFKSYSKIYAEREKLIKDAQVEYNKATEIKRRQVSLEEKEQQLRQEADIVSEQNEKERLLAEAAVVNQKAAALNASIDSLNHIIKIKNYLIRQKDNELTSQLNNIEPERANKIVQMAKVVYVENENSNVIADNIGAEPAVEDDEVEAEDAKETEETSLQNINTTVEKEQNIIEELPPFDVGGEPVDEKNNSFPTNDELKDTEENIFVEDEQEVEEQSISLEAVDQNNIETEIVENIDDLPPNEHEAPEMNFIPETIVSDIFIVKPSSTSLYNNSNPIPIEPKMPSGIIYQIQVGAFKNPIPQDLFKGFAPLMGEKGPNGITRYTAGFFNDFRSADSSKLEIRKLGYPDAFVVAFLNGKRISVNEARNISGDSVNRNVSTQISTSTSELDKFGNEYINESNNDILSEKEIRVNTNTEKLPSAFTATDVEPVTNSKNVDGLYYSVQIGVYSKPVQKGKFPNFENLLVDVLSSGLYRYHVGIFNNIENATQVKKQLANDNFSDAFVVVYYNGARITFSEAERIKNQ